VLSASLLLLNLENNSPSLHLMILSVSSMTRSTLPPSSSFWLLVPILFLISLV
jgi:hypothetical protein